MILFENISLINCQQSFLFEKLKPVSQKTDGSISKVVTPLKNSLTG